MTTKHVVEGVIKIINIEAEIQSFDGKWQRVRVLPQSMDYYDIDDYLRLLISSHLNDTKVRVRGVKRKGKGVNPIVINDIKEIKVK